MAIRKLGPLGSEYALPSIAIVLPVTIRKKVELVEMIDGSLRPGFSGKEHKEWEIRFPKITKAQLDDLIYLRKLSEILRWQNPDESYTWYDVVISDFKYNSDDPRSPTIYFYGSMSLVEIV